MCGRYNIIDDSLTQALVIQLGIDLRLPTRYNIAPTEQVPVIHEADGQRQCRQMRWWLVPSWSDGPSTKYAMFNARAESVATSPAFRGPFRRQRAILPASNFIEWQPQDNGKQAWQIARPDAAIAFAGLWDCWQRDDQVIYSCTIVTTDAVPQFRHIHKRMPLMLDSAACEQWLDHNQPASAIAPLLQPHLPGPLAVTPISNAINNARHKIPATATGPSETIEAHQPDGD